MTKPIIHFAHANGLPSICYQKMLANMTDSYDIKTLPLIGVDPQFPVRDNWHELADQVADSIRRQSDVPVIGMGHSLGALCTFMAAHKYPELFRGLVVMDPPIVNGVASLLFALMKLIGQIDRISPSGKSKHRRETWPSREEAKQSLGGKSLFKAFDPECFDAYIQHGLSDSETGVSLTIPAATEVAIFRTTPTDVWRYRSPLKVPGLFIAGAQSEFIKVNFGTRMARQHNMDYRLTPGGHMFPLENPEKTAATIRAGLQQMFPS